MRRYVLTRLAAAVPTLLVLTLAAIELIATEVALALGWQPAVASGEPVAARS